MDPHCKAPAFAAERQRTVHNCCHIGCVKLIPLLSYAELLETLLLDRGENGKLFQEHIWKDNNVLTFTSFNTQYASPDKIISLVCVISDVTTHATTSIKPQNGQIYIQVCNRDKSVEHRLLMNSCNSILKIIVTNNQMQEI